MDFPLMPGLCCYNSISLFQAYPLLKNLPDNYSDHTNKGRIFKKPHVFAYGFLIPATYTFVTAVCTNNIAIWTLLIFSNTLWIEF